MRPFGACALKVAGASGMPNSAVLKGLTVLSREIKIKAVLADSPTYPTGFHFRPDMLCWPFRAPAQHRQPTPAALYGAHVSDMAEYRHFIYTLLALLALLAGLSLADVFNHAALYVLGFAMLVAGAFWWGDHSRRRIFRD